MTGALRRRLLLNPDRSEALTAARQAVEVAGRVDVPWSDRCDLLRQHVLGAWPVLLVLDNFEDNLTRAGGTWHIGGGTVAGLLAALTRDPGRSRLLITTRHPFTLPEEAHTRLIHRHLGPMTYAETLKFLWSLPHLDGLDDEELEQVWRLVGGHPRTLEYLDALLAHGQARLPDITARLRDAARAKLGDTSAGDAWLGTARTLDTALAETLTLTADDVLLGALLADLAPTPDAVRLLLGASVYREPVDRNALLHQIGRPDDTAAHTPDRQAATQRILKTGQAFGLQPDALTALVNNTPAEDWPDGFHDALALDLAELTTSPRPPYAEPEGLDPLIELLASYGLLAVEPGREVFVHRSTATTLHQLHTTPGTSTGTGEVLRRAHRDAAQYWTWRVRVWPQDRDADVHDLLEARHHLLAAGEDTAVAELTEDLYARLHQQGAWDLETALIHDTLTRIGDSPRRPAWIHQLGILAQARGDYDEAEHRYRQSLDTLERFGDQAGAARSHHQLGTLAQDRGDYAEAEHRYRQSLDTFQRFGDQASAARSSSRLGLLVTEQDRLIDAVPLHLAALDIRLRLQVPQASIDLSALNTLQSRLGDNHFAEQAGRHLDPDSARRLMDLLDQQDQNPPDTK